MKTDSDNCDSLKTKREICSLGDLLSPLSSFNNNNTLSHTAMHNLKSREVEGKTICVNRRMKKMVKQIKVEDERLIGDRMLLHSSVSVSVSLTGAPSVRCPEAVPTDTLSFFPPDLFAFIRQKSTPSPRLA